MSQETAQWLNTNVLVGCTDRRGTAWHHRADLQTEWFYVDPDTNELVTGTGNHYPQGIPMRDVIGRLFAWEALEEPIYAKIGDDYVAIPNQKRIFPSDDPSHTFWISRESYTPHDYTDSLVSAVSDIIDTPGSELVISSAGLLQKRAIGWVEVSVPDSITTPDGIEFRPNLLATTSLNGKVATTYKRTVTDVVCDNTRTAALAERGQQYKVMHTKYSNLRLASAREALAIIHTTADEIEEEFHYLCTIDVTDRQFFAIVDEMLTPGGKAPESKMGQTIVEKKKGELSQLWRNDTRVTPWKNTGYGTIQAFNTWEQHYKGTRRGATKAERNMLATISGDIENEDRKVYQTMTKVLANA